MADLLTKNFTLEELRPPDPIAAGFLMSRQAHERSSDPWLALEDQPLAGPDAGKIGVG